MSNPEQVNFDTFCPDLGFLGQSRTACSFHNSGPGKRVPLSIPRSSNHVIIPRYSMAIQDALGIEYNSFRNDFLTHSNDLYFQGAFDP